MSQLPAQVTGRTSRHDDQAVVYAGSDIYIRSGLPAPPGIIARAGQAGEYCWTEFFSGQLRNRHTRAAYLHAVERFLTWVEPIEPEISRITPGLLGRYFDEMPLSTPSKKLHLSAIRRFCNLLVQRHVIVLNPALSVQTERYAAVEGRTPIITTEQARALLQSIDCRTARDFRDRAIIGTLIYTAVRAGAIAKLRVRDLVDEGGPFVLKFQEKGGKQRVIPVRFDLQLWLLDYLAIVDPLRDGKDLPMFRALDAQGRITDRPFNGANVCRMVKRRLAAAGLPTHLSPHSFRACTATDLLLQGVGLESVQYLLGHADVRVTRLYDRRQHQVTRNVVERISV